MLLGTILATLTSFHVTSRVPRIYKTSTTLMVGRFIESTNPSAQDFFTIQQLAQSYVQLAERQPVLQSTADALGLELEWQVLAERVDASLVAGTQLIQISAADTDPDRARLLADEVARQLILQSPTPADQQQAQHREFVNQQLLELQAKIEDGQARIRELEGRLALENSARGIQDIQDQVAALQQKITTWQSNYAGLIDFYAGSHTNYLSVVDPAILPSTPISPNIAQNVLLAAALSLTLTAGAAFLLEYLDDTLKSGEHVERALGLPTLGAISRIRAIHHPRDHLVTVTQPRSSIAESYRVLRTNIQFSSLPALTEDGRREAADRLLVTSVGPREGKTTTACNLAIAVAQAGRRVILVDSDLRQPSIHRFLGLRNQVGLTSLLLEEAMPVQAALSQTEVAGLQVMTSGPLPPNPSELLGSQPMRQRLDQMKRLADVIILDSPPAMVVADATILGILCSGLILVVDAGRTRADVARRGKHALDQVGLKVLGVVLNQLKPGRGSYDYHRYYEPLDGNAHWHKRQRRLPGFPLGESGWLAHLTCQIQSRLPVNGQSSVTPCEEASPQGVFQSEPAMPDRPTQP